MTRRARGNLALLPRDYESVIHQWLQAYHPNSTFEVAFGPMVTTTRRVTRDSFCRAVPLMRMLLEGGCSQGVVMAHRLEAAITMLVAQRPSLLGRLGEFAHNTLSNHIQIHLTCLRDLKREDDIARPDTPYAAAVSTNRCLAEEVHHNRLD